MKKGFQYFLLIVSVLALVFSMAACKSVKSISVSEDHEFQAVYVLGQELNLSGGVLKVDDGKNITEMPLDSEEITVSGYDKNTLGKQTLTVSYEDVTTEITVTVVENVTVNNAIVDYLVGDKFDRSKGSVKVTDSDGSTRTLPFSSDFISVSGFDSTTAKSGLELKVVCTVNGEKQEGTLKVNIHGIDSVEFRRPNKITYTSHYQGDLDISGGRFILKGNEGKIKREIAISEDMVVDSGFDVKAVTAQNSPLTQTITVTYNNVPYTYDVQLTYTDVSVFLDNADAFLAIDWEGEKLPEIEAELGELALELMRAYTDMAQADKVFIDETLAFNVARTAMVYGFDVWGENILLFKDAFAIEYGKTVLYLKDYEAVKNALVLFEDENSAIYTLAPLLLELIELYGDKVVYENASERIYFNSYPVMDEYTLAAMQGVLEHAIAIYDLVQSVPDDWKTSGLEPYYQNVGQAATQMMGASYVAVFPEIYYLISDWRSGSDLFDMVYTYLYETDNKRIIDDFIVYGLPTQINELYGYIFNAVVAMEGIQKVQYTDTTSLFYYYYLATDCAEKIKAQKDSVESYLYENVALNALLGMSTTEEIKFDVLFDYIRTAGYGYRDLSAGLLDIAAYDAIMRDYVYLVKDTIEIEGYTTTEAYGKRVKSLFDQYVALSPTQQYNLLSTLNSLYTRGIPELAFDDLGSYAEYTSYFISLINRFMRSKLSEEYADAYNNLVLAIEVYANRFGYPEWESDFTARMDKVTSYWSTMEGSDKENFNHYLGGAYSKYMAIKATIGTTAELGQWSDEIDALRQALTDMQTAYYYLTSRNTYNYNYFFASFERASDIAADILQNAPANVVQAYYHEALFEAYTGADGSEAVWWSLDYTLSIYRNFYIDMLLFFGSSGVNIYDTYLEKEMDEFLALYYDMVSAFVNKKENQSPVFDKAKTLAVMQAFSKLDSNVKALFVTMEGNLDLYYAALALFTSEAFTENAAAVAEKLFSLEQNYYSYEVSQSAVNLNAIREILGQIKELHQGLEGADATSFADLESLYIYYVEKCDQLLAQ